MQRDKVPCSEGTSHGWPAYRPSVLNLLERVPSQMSCMHHCRQAFILAGIADRTAFNHVWPAHSSVTQSSDAP